MRNLFQTYRMALPLLLIGFQAIQLPAWADSQYDGNKIPHNPNQLKLKVVDVPGVLLGDIWQNHYVVIEENGREIFKTNSYDTNSDAEQAKNRLQEELNLAISADKKVIYQHDEKGSGFHFEITQVPIHSINEYEALRKQVEEMSEKLSEIQETLKKTQGELEALRAQKQAVNTPKELSPGQQQPVDHAGEDQSGKAEVAK